VQGIYTIHNTITGDQYIGSAKNFYSRKKKHLQQLKNNKHHSIVLQRAWNKYGENKFKFFLLENVNDINELIKKEQWWIDNTNSVYNICKIAGSSLGIKRSKESREKMRQAHLGEKHPEWRNKIKSISQGGENHWTKKKKFSEESKKRMSETHKKLYKNGYQNPNKKIILQYDKNGKFIKKWYSISSAVQFYKTEGIKQCLIKKNKTAAGFIWKYENE
jgi:group I intron endonuclease